MLGLQSDSWVRISTPPLVSEDEDLSTMESLQLQCPQLLHRHSSRSHLIFFSGLAYIHVLREVFPDYPVYNSVHITLSFYLALFFFKTFMTTWHSINYLVGCLYSTTPPTLECEFHGHRNLACDFVRGCISVPKEFLDDSWCSIITCWMNE